MQANVRYTWTFRPTSRHDVQLLLYDTPLVDLRCSYSHGCLGGSQLVKRLPLAGVMIPGKDSHLCLSPCYAVK